MEVTEISDLEFSQLSKLFYGVAGINLSPVKKSLVCSRLAKRLKEYNLSSYGDYYRLIVSGREPAEMQVAVDLLTTNETHFFREPKHFDFLRTQVLAKWRPGRMFRVWSAASSTGEEPYSIAMECAEGLPEGSWEVVGSDLSTRVLETARAGLYPMDRAHEVPKHYLHRWCLKGVGTQEGNFLIARDLRNRVHFMQVNLNNALPQLGEFDVIFLRNVMIYFETDVKRAVVSRLLPHLKSGGHLIIGHSETLHDINESLIQVLPTVYKKQ